MIKDILVKNADSFLNRGVHYDEKNEPLSAHLFRINAPEWQTLRRKLTPAFSSGKLKYMFQNILDCGTVLEQVLRTKIQNKSEVLQVSFGTATSSQVLAVVVG